MQFDQVDQNEDFRSRRFEKNKQTLCLHYFSSVCNEDEIFTKLITIFYKTESADEFATYLQSFPNGSEETDETAAVEKMLDGHVMITLREKTISISMKNFATRSVSVSTDENILQGPKDGLSENIDTSLNLIRNRYKSKHLLAESYYAGNKTKSKLILLFDEQLVDKTLVEQLREKVTHLQVDLIQSAGQLQKSLINNKFNLFPLFLTTERPDRVVQNLAKGHLVFLLEGSSWALIGPSTFFDFFHSMDDVVQMPIIGRFLISIRYLALLITLVLPSLYISIISYSPDLLKVQFTLLVAGSRLSVPFPSYVEILFMLIMMEFLIEASIRLPKTISPTATTVGGLILGQAATEAGLVAEVMIIVISAVAISNFVIPVNAMHQAIRIARYPLIILASFLGIIGVVVGFLALIAYLCQLRSLGKPYLKLL